MKKLHYFCLGYTLIELLIAVSLSLLLLLGVTEMFRHVGSTMSDTQKSLNMSANINATAMQLRSDLEKIDSALASKPNDMIVGASYTDTAIMGYLEITEGMNNPYSQTVASGLHVSINAVAKNPDTVGDGTLYAGIDQTVGDVDDILAFTAQANPDYAFRGLINGSMSESLHAEIIWFVRGTTLYRRVLLIDDDNPSPPKSTADQSQSSFYARNDLSVHISGGTIIANTLQDLLQRENRFAHKFTTTFPYPLYDSNEAWYFLRMPTLEETVHTSWSLTSLPALGSLADDLKMNEIPIFPSSSTPIRPYWDFGNNPNGLSGTNWTLDQKSGSLSNYVLDPRDSRAGEDIVLKNVISFDVKVWNPYWVPCQNDSDGNSHWAAPQYIDLGQDSFVFINPTQQKEESCQVFYDCPTATMTNYVNQPTGYGFTFKGRYNTSTATGTRRTVTDNEQKKERLRDTTNTNQLWTGNFPMPCVFDSWTNQYQASYLTDTGYVQEDAETWRCPPPYTEDLDSIQVTIRCFEPQSGHIKQVRVVQNFPRSP
jgi:type II secretory pathway pseudopilin PulG